METIKINFSRKTIMHILKTIEEPEKIFDYLLEEMNRMYPDLVPFRAYTNNDEGLVIELSPDPALAEEFGMFYVVSEDEKLTVAYLCSQARLSESDTLYLVECYIELRAQPVFFERNIEDFDMLGIPVYQALADHLNKSIDDILTLLKTEGLEVNDLRIALVDMENNPGLYFKTNSNK
jgi:hypothetical protein